MYRGRRRGKPNGQGSRILEQARELWEDEREEQKVSVAIHLPSSLLERPQDWDFRVSEDGLALEITVQWPRCITDMLYLHKSWLSHDYKGYINHSRVLSFLPFLRRLRSKSNQKVTSSCSIALPFAVKPDVTIMRRNRKFLWWRETSQKVLYVTLEAPEKEYLVEAMNVSEVVIA